MRWLGWLRSLVTRPAGFDHDLREELDAHLDARADALVRDRGLTPEAARRQARLEFGSMASYREQAREAGGLRWLDDLRQDVRHSARALRRQPGFTAVATITLALGIGANAAIFTVLHAVVLEPLRYDAPDRLVGLTETIPASERPNGRPQFSGAITGSELVELRARASTLSSVSLNAGPSIVTLTGLGEPLGLQGDATGSATFETLGVPPLLGRTFTAADDDTAGGTGALVLSYATWRRYFDGDPAVVGRAVTLTNRLMPAPGEAPRPYTIVGVMPETFAYPDEQIQFWIAAPWRAGQRGILIARLAAGVSTAAAQAEVGSILRGLRDASPATRYTIDGLGLGGAEAVRRPLIILMIATALVLLIACVNVASLLVARTIARRRELAVRMALGAGRSRIVRHLLTESLLLASLGAAGGAAVAAGGVALLRRLATTLTRMDLGVQLYFPRLKEIAIDGTVLAFIAGAALVAGLLFGLAPALRYARGREADVRPDLAPTDGGARRSRQVLVAVEAALATVLLVGAALLLNSFRQLLAVPMGFDPNSVITFQVAMPPGRSDPSETKRFADEVVARVGAAPQIESAAYGKLPLVALVDRSLLRHAPAVPNRPALDSPELRLVSRDFLAVMGTRVVAGRGFTEADRAGSPRVLLLNETAARHEFPGGDALGAHVYAGPDGEPWEIAGIVEDVRVRGQESAPTPQAYASVDQWPAVSFPLGPYFAVRAPLARAGAIAAIRAAVRAVDPAAGLFNVATMNDLLSNRVARERMYVVLLAAFAAIAAMLAGIGLYGVLAYGVARRAREIGIRMALGARGRPVVALVLGQSLAMTALGVAIGLAAAAGLTRFMQGMLFGITPLDPATFVEVAIGFALVAALASYLPARRATKVDPMTALRCE